MVLADLKKVMGKDAVLADFFSVTTRTITRWKKKSTFPHPIYEEKAKQHLAAIATPHPEREEAGA